MKGKFERRREETFLGKEDALSSRGPARVRVALAYPNTYPVGMANLGFQTIYRLLNGLEGISCERVFLPQAEEPPRSLESGQPVGEFDVLAFSVSFELDYPNLLRVLSLAGIPLLSSERGEESPLVMVGGVCTFLNPEPLAPFSDLFVVGEAEEILPNLFRAIEAWTIGEISKEELLFELAHIHGIYVPRFYRPIYGKEGRLAALEPVGDVPSSVERRYVKNLNSYPTFSPILTPESHFRDMMLVEGGKGCPRGCRFCVAGHLYRPFRWRSKENILSTVNRLGDKVRRVGLIGSALSDYPYLEELCGELVGLGYELALSSLRADALTEGLVEVLVRGRLKTVTIAPETGSERLREAIYKKLSDEQILRAVAVAARSGLKNLRLYFMVGLPGEEDEDIQAIAHLVKRIREVSDSYSPGAKGGQLTVSINPFVPKASTPFQWCPMEGEKVLSGKLKLIAQDLRQVTGVKIIGESPRMAVLQGIFSLGDRRVGMALFYRYQEGVTWGRAWRMAEVDPGGVVFREKPFDAFFPWDFLEVGLSKERLWWEYERALEGLRSGHPAF